MTPTNAPTLPPLVPVMNFAPELLLLAQGVKLVFLDVDGVLTDGGIYFSEHAPSGTGQQAGVGESIKRFNTLDGHGLKLLQKAGITPVIITGRDSVVLRAQRVKVVFFDVDGVLTDGGIYFSEQAPSGTGQKAGAGESIKRFNTLDGHGR